MLIFQLIPRSIRRLIHRTIHSLKHDVRFGRNAYAKNSRFEGANILRENSALINGEIGYGSYISENSVIKNAKIGRYSCIGPNVTNHYGKHPSTGFASIHPAFYSLSAQAGFSYVDEQLFKEHSFVHKNLVNVIGNDVWIGCNVILMDGVTIGNGAIIAAGSVVTKDVEDYSIVGGVPARFIKWRFDPKHIDDLKRIQWWNMDIHTIKKLAKYFNNVELLIKYIDTHSAVNKL